MLSPLKGLIVNLGSFTVLLTALAGRGVVVASGSGVRFEMCSSILTKAE